MIDKLYDLVNKAVQVSGNNWQVIFGYQNLPRLVKPYIQLNVMNIDIPDHVYYSELDDNNSRTLSGWRKAAVEIQVFAGLQSLTVINNLALILQTETMLEYQAEIDCAIGQRLFIGYVPELINTSQWEGRGIYHFEFFYTEHVTETLENICGVNLQGSYIGGAADPDIYKIFDPSPVDAAIVCIETIPCPDDLETTWDNTDTNWDNNGVTEWDKTL